MNTLNTWKHLKHIEALPHLHWFEAGPSVFILCWWKTSPFPLLLLLLLNRFQPLLSIRLLFPCKCTESIIIFISWKFYCFCCGSAFVEIEMFTLCHQLARASLKAWKGSKRIFSLIFRCLQSPIVSVKPLLYDPHSLDDIMRIAHDESGPSLSNSKMHFSELFAQVGLKLCQSLMRFALRIEISLNDFKMFNWDPITSKCSHVTRQNIFVNHLLWDYSELLRH